ncbi:MAG: Crp/Fnr family transcriptional regulator [Burkholderiaceae bacterium]|nr:Crp/Fnr family transcriptional regulator [Burkholderiaceae bacterium]
MKTPSDWHAKTGAILRKNEWSSQFKQATLDSLVYGSRLLKLSPGEEFIRSGDLVKSLGVVLEGTLHASRTNAAGKRHIVGYFGPVQIVNLIPVLDDQRSVHDITAHDETTLLNIPKEVFLSALDSEPMMVRSVLRLLCLRSRALYDNTSDNALRSLRARCARMLILLMASHGEVGSSQVNIMLKISQDEFADMIGRTRQSVNPELKQLERDGIIDMKYSRFIIRDPAALREIVEHDGDI